MEPIKWLNRLLALGVSPMLAAIALGVLAQQPPKPAKLAFAPSLAACLQPPVFSSVYQSGEKAVVPQGEGFHFGGQGWVESAVCSAGTLSITAEGQLGGDEQPQLTVALDSSLLADLPFNQERTVQLRIPEAGRIFLGYFNDYYLTDARVISVREIKLSGSGCQDFQDLQFAPGQGVRMDPVAQTASLASGLPVTFTPCRAGTLQMHLLGREGQATLPVLRITQGKRTLVQQSVDTVWRPLTLEVTRQPLTFQLINPYWKTLADRNLKVRRLQFTPDSVP